MFKSTLSAAGLALAVAAFTVAALPSHSAEPTVVRKVLMQQDLPIPGYAAALVSVEIPVGGREGRHTHPGALLVYVQEGELSLDYEGKAQVTYKPGETFFVEANKIHEGINKGTVPIKALASFVVPKGQPITKQVE
jgi:quercetin dioxygenase-like cupin family protein